MTLPAVAERAGVNSSTLYRRWGSVAALLADVAKDHGDAEAPPPPSLEQVLDRIVAPLYFRMVFSVPGTDEAYARQLVAGLIGGAPT